MRFQVFKSSSQPARKDQDSGRPYDVQQLIEAYYHNAYHATCVNLKSICILGDGIENPDVTQRLRDCVREDSVFTLLQKTILDLRIFGDAFWEIVPVGASVEIYHIPAWTMSVGKSGGWSQELESGKVDFTEEQVWHFREPSLVSQIWGCPDYLPLIEDGTIDTLTAIKAYNKNFFKNNAIPDSIMFIKGGDLGPATETGLRRFFREKFQGVENAAKFCVAPVPEGVEIQLERLQITTDGKFMELSDSLIAEVISCHGVPPRLAGIMIPGSLGGGGEAAGELKIFMQTRIKPLQNILGGQLDEFFTQIMGLKTDITFVPFDVLPSAAEDALNLLRG